MHCNKIALKMSSVKLIVAFHRVGAQGPRGARVRGAGALPPCHEEIQIARIYAHSAPLEFIRRFYLRILLFVSLLLVPIENFYVCMRLQPSARKEASPEHFGATVMKFSSRDISLSDYRAIAGIAAPVDKYFHWHRNGLM